MDESVEKPRALGSPLIRAIPGLAFLLLILVAWFDPLFLRRNFAGRDLIAYNLPMEKAIHDAYARGQFPVWVPEVSGGRPLIPNPNAGAMYPLRIVLSVLPFPLAMRIFPVFHWAAAGLGLILLLRSIGVSRAGAFVGAVTYSFSGVVVSEVCFPHVLPGMALLPWIVWAVHRPARPAPKAFLLSFLFALDMLAGDVFTISLGILCAVLWILCEAPRKTWRPQLLTLMGSVGLATLVALPQIVATVLWLPETNRAVVGMKWGEVLLFSISPYRLLEFVVPYPFGAVWSMEEARIWGWQIYYRKMMGLYVSLYAGALALIALFATWKSRASGTRFPRVLVGVAILLSVPPFLVPEPWRDSPSPLPLRNPEKFAVAIAFGLAILAGLALDHFRSRRSLPRWILTVGVLLGLAAVAATIWPQSAASSALFLTRSDARFLPVVARELPIALTEAALLWLLTWLGLGLLQSDRRVAVGAALLILTAVPILSNRRLAWSFREEEVFAPPKFAKFLQKHDPEGQYRALGESLYRLPGQVERSASISDMKFTEFARRNWTQHGHALWGRGTVFNADFDAGDLSRIESARKLSAIAARYKDGGVYFEHFALRWGTRYRDEAAVPGYHRIGGTAIEDWDENPGALPAIRLALGWREEPGPLQALQNISKLGRGHIVVETGRGGSGTAPPGTVRILEERPEKLRLETDAPAPTWLFVIRGFWSHRTVRVDGRPVEVFPAQLAFSAIRVPAGRHRVDWEEHFPGWNVSRIGPLFYLLGIALLFARQRQKRIPE